MSRAGVGPPVTLANLPAATTPLDGTEKVALLQNGALRVADAADIQDIPSDVADQAAASAAEAAASATAAAATATAVAADASTITALAAAAAASAVSAGTSAGAAATSAGTAATSETNAAASASSASTSASTATTQASNASTSASNASTSASTATTQASNASTSASNAATSASNASTSASNAATSETNAAASATLAQANVIQWVVAGGSADAITATYSPAITSLTDGLIVGFRATAANATTTPTFAPNGLTPHTITKSGGAALGISDIPGALAESIVRYNLANTRWELINLTYRVVLASGKTLTVNNTMTMAGTDGQTYTHPAVSDTMAGLGTQQTFTKGQAGAQVTLTDGATVTPDFSLGNNFLLMIGGNRTLAVPSNPVTGQAGRAYIRQDTTGSRTLAYAWIYTWAGGTAGVLSTAGCSLDGLFYDVELYGTSTVTVTIAAPGVMTWTAHPLNTGDRLQLTTTGALPTGLAASTTYWVTKVDANTFKLSTSLANCAAGTFITTTGSQSGVHTAVAGAISLSLNKAFA